MTEADLADFVECYKPGSLDSREETYSDESPNGRWRRFGIDDIMARDKLSLDITWIKTEDDISETPLSELLEEMSEKAESIAEAVAQLEELLGGIES